MSEFWRRAFVAMGLGLSLPAAAAQADNPSAKTSELEPGALAGQAAAAQYDPGLELGPDQSPIMLRLQVLLARAHASPGVIDGFAGDNVGKAIAAFEMMTEMPVDGKLDPAVWQALVNRDDRPPLETYRLTKRDVRGPFTRRIPTDYGRLAKMKRLGYRSVEEMLAERFHMSEALLRQLNPHASFRRAGTDILVADVGEPAEHRVVRVVADKARRQLFAYSEDNHLVSAYPATIGSEELPSPSGTHEVNAIAFRAAYWYRPDINFKQGRNDKPLRLPPGPNNPIGAVWIDLTEPTYGIHGTPEPSKIDKTNSHGCVRLTNWDALELAKLVKKGVPVEFVD